MSNHSINEYIEQSNDESILEAIRYCNALNSTDQDSQKSSAHSSTFKSPITKKPKMVHAPPSCNNKDDMNELYLKQLSIMKSRVNMLDISGEDYGNKRFRSAPLDEKIIYVKSAGNIKEENQSMHESDDRFDENIKYSNIENEIFSNRNNITPRMFEVPPKKTCVRLKTPNFSEDEQNLNLKSLWTHVNVSHYSDNKSTNTEGTWIRVSLENIPNTLKSQLSIDPRTIIHRSSSNTSDTSIEDVRLQSASNITSIESPEFQISPCTPERERSFLYPSTNHHRIDSSNSVINIESDYISKYNYDVIRNQSPVRTKTSNKGNFKNKIVLPNAVEESSPETVLVVKKPIDASCYNVPLKHLGEIDSYSVVKDVVSNLALHFFKSKGTYDEIKLDTSVEEKVSFRSLAEEVPNGLSENEMKVNTIRRILSENIENFRSKRVYATRRPQVTDFAFYNVSSGANQEIGAGEHVLMPDSTEDAFHREDHDYEEDEDSEPAGCCTLKACAEFMFPKREPRFFE